MKEKKMTKKPIALFLTDTHLKNNNTELVYDIFNQALGICEEMGIKYIFHGGDFFTNRVGQNLITLITKSKILKLFEDSNVKLIGIAGNHDKTDQDSENSYLDIFSKYNNFEVIRKEHYKHIGGIDFAFLPFFTSSFNSRLDKLKSSLEGRKYKKILITHHAFNGVKNNGGTIVEDGIEKKRVSFFNKTLVGHYHDSSELSENIIYTGSAYQCNFGENSEDKGFCIIYSNGSLEYIKSNFPKYIKVELNAEDDISNEIEAYSELNDNVRFVFKGKKEDFDKIDVSELDNLGIDCKFIPYEIDEEVVKAEDGEFTSFDKKSIAKLFVKYCKLNEIPPKKITNGIKLLLSEKSNFSQ